MAGKDFSTERAALASALVALRAIVSVSKWECLALNGVNAPVAPTVTQVMDMDMVMINITIAIIALPQRKELETIIEIPLYFYNVLE